MVGRVRKMGHVGDILVSGGVSHVVSNRQAPGEASEPGAGRYRRRVRPHGRSHRHRHPRCGQDAGHQPVNPVQPHLHQRLTRPALRAASAAAIDDGPTLRLWLEVIASRTNLRKSRRRPRSWGREETGFQDHVLVTPDGCETTLPQRARPGGTGIQARSDAAGGIHSSHATHGETARLRRRQPRQAARPSGADHRACSPATRDPARRTCAPQAPRSAWPPPGLPR
jgi:hypothetical protein